jgi:hypothetical protein
MKGSTRSAARSKSFVQDLSSRGSPAGSVTTRGSPVRIATVATFSSPRSIRLPKNLSRTFGLASVVLCGRAQRPSGPMRKALHLPRPAASLIPCTTLSISPSTSRVEAIEAASLERILASRRTRLSLWLMNEVASAMRSRNTTLMRVSPTTVRAGVVPPSLAKRVSEYRADRLIAASAACLYPNLFATTMTSSGKTQNRSGR